ncbi:cardiolipin synthase [Alkalicoccus luteus]|uniref:Cardiolipin synthase n=1 Tax=Alkalicoccus luteus TaxID=1237094 RepID=A0A969PP86_9BACI|nr:cardiolipin synthase [Alkalicoccus luteus]NJP36913.1 cardiolipin synthase [Alkalicoccus luteus]
MDVSVVLAWTLNTVILMNILLACFVIFVERRDAGSTWAWVLVLFFLPILGFIIYLFLGRQLKSDNFYNLSVDEQTYYSHHIQGQLERLHNEEMDIPPAVQYKYRQLMEMNLRAPKSLIGLSNSLMILHDGHQKFDQLIADIENAQSEINIQYYIIQRDALGRRLLDRLEERAASGVKVRLLYDGVGSRSLKEKDFNVLREHGGEVHIFFPALFGPVNLRMNNRNHRKVCIIDGKIGYIGGFNVGNEYLGIDKKFGYWRDTHLRMEGDAVSLIQDRFILDWTYAGDKKHWEEESFAFASHKIRSIKPVQIVTSGPNSKTEHLKNMMIKMIMSAEHDIYIQTPYFIPDKSFMDACKMAVTSGVRMHIMIPGVPDHPFVFWASRLFLGELLQYEGVNVYLYEEGFLHAKMMTVDSEIATVGTTNLDARSFRLNFEINALVFDTHTAMTLEELFESDKQRCRVLTKKEYDRRSAGVKIKEGVSGLLSPIL